MKSIYGRMAKQAVCRTGALPAAYMEDRDLAGPNVGTVISGLLICGFGIKIRRAE